MAGPILFAQGVKQIQFTEADSSSDWQFPYQLVLPQVAGWDVARDLIVLGMSPDYAKWDDYGYRDRSAFPARPDLWAAPVYQANSDEASGVVSLIDPNLVSIVVPWNVMRALGPGGCHVGVQYRTKDGTDRRTTLCVGRLPIIRGL